MLQPHTFSRTQRFLPDFAAALQGAADWSLLLDVYGSREAGSASGVTPASLSAVMEALLTAAGCQAQHVSGGAGEAVVEAIVARLHRTAADRVLVIALGAGDVTRIGPLLLQRLLQLEGY